MTARAVTLRMIGAGGALLLAAATLFCSYAYVFYGRVTARLADAVLGTVGSVIVS